MDYKCPYCGQDSYAKSSKNKGKFTDWDSVIRHTSTCYNNNHEFIIHKKFGPIHYSEINNLSNRELRIKYPKISIGELNRTLRRNNIEVKNIPQDITWDKEKIIDSIQNYYLEFGKIPAYRDLDSKVQETLYPSTASLKKYFGSFNKAIEAAGFKPNIQNGFGIDTYSLDGHLYRSRAEAYFADNYLYNKYTYEIEPSYPSPNKQWKYDWYIKELNTYIELDGGLRPERIKEKIKTNTLTNTKCIFIKTSNIYNKQSLKDFLG
jgi:sulfur relay (sulfurtransferase) DsrC/TusE family protein